MPEVPDRLLPEDVTGGATPLQGVIASGPITAAVTVAAGFKPPPTGFSAQLTGAANLYLLSLDAKSLTLINSGCDCTNALGLAAEIVLQMQPQSFQLQEKIHTLILLYVKCQLMSK